MTFGVQGCGMALEFIVYNDVTMEHGNSLLLSLLLHGIHLTDMLLSAPNSRQPLQDVPCQVRFKINAGQAHLPALCCPTATSARSEKWTEPALV